MPTLQEQPSERKMDPAIKTSGPQCAGISLFRDGSLVVFCSSTQKEKEKKIKKRKKKRRTHDGNLCRQFLFSIFATHLSDVTSSNSPGRRWDMTTTNKSCRQPPKKGAKSMPPQPRPHLRIWLFVSGYSPTHFLKSCPPFTPQHIQSAKALFVTNKHFQKETNKQTNSHFPHPLPPFLDLIQRQQQAPE